MFKIVVFLRHSYSSSCGVLYCILLIISVERQERWKQIGEDGLI
ncbi:MAG: hypothetical protein WBA22_17810 [Candidatus Methanofastidiosia archaeon]